MLVSAFGQPSAVAQRIGKSGGGGELDQSVLLSPRFCSTNAMSPVLVSASSGFPRSFVVHESLKVLFFVSFTVTFSSVAVVWYCVSDHSYVHSASEA